MTETRTGGQRRAEPVFILAPARSYSTVTTAILGGHPGIYAFPELVLFDAPTVGELLDEQRRRPHLHPYYIRVHQSGLRRAVAQLHEGSQAKEAVARASRWLAQHASWSTTRLMDYLLELVSPLLAVEKSPDTVRSDRSLQMCLAAYPRARYLHLTRHPVDTQRSMQSHWRHCGRRPLSEAALIAQAASTWYQDHARIVTALARLPEQQWIRVRAEDILREPRVWLPVILRWLGLPEDKKIISGMLETERWQFAGTGPSGQLYGGDSAFMTSPALRPVPAPRPVSFDPSWQLPEEACQRMTRLASYLGY